MGLKVRQRGLASSFKIKDVDDINGIFTCICDEKDFEDFEISYGLFVDKSYHPDDFLVYLLAKKEVRENDIYQVLAEKDTRIGWCFPAVALDSREHDYAENPHFLRYAYVSVVKILNSFPDVAISKVPDLEESGRIKFSEFFHDGTVIFAVSKKTLSSGYSFSIPHWLPSLFCYGYVPLTRQKPSSIVFQGERPTGGKIHIKQVSESLKSHNFIEVLFSELVAYESNPVLSFFYVYQIVELILEEIFQYEQTKLVNELINSVEDSLRTKDVLAKFQDILSEKKRLGLLQSAYVKKLPIEHDLRDSCNAFLTRAGRKGGVNMKDYLYLVRNFLFHRYRDVAGDSFADIQKVVDCSIPFLSDLLHAFRLPEKEEVKAESIQ